MSEIREALPPPPPPPRKLNFRRWPKDKINWPKDKINRPKDKINWPKDKINRPKDKINWPKDKINWSKDKINWPKAVAEISVGWVGSSNCQFVGNFHFIGSSETHELFYKTVIISKFPTN